MDILFIGASPYTEESLPGVVSACREAEHLRAHINKEEE